MARTFEAKLAKRESVPLLIGLMGPSGGGKTFSALRLATGIQQVTGGEIFGIDTEARRMAHYADRFTFQHVEFNPPFGSLDYLEAIQFAAKQGAKVIVVDSMTHEHIGQGGYLEVAEQKVDRIAGNDFKKREAVKMLGWAEVGPKRQRMIEGIKQINANLIFCFRAKEKVKPVKTPNKTEIVDMGFMPIAGEDLLFEMTVNCLLLPKADGVPAWRSDHIGERMMMKLPDQFRGIFTEGKALDEETGRALAEWARGGAPAAPAAFEASPPASTPSKNGDRRSRVQAYAREKAKRGEDALDEWLHELKPEDRQYVNEIWAELQGIAQEAARQASADQRELDMAEA